jgi:phosphatidate cytidylyltransferase
MLLPRLITAIIGIPVVIICIYWGGIPFFLLALTVVFFMLKEYFVLLQKGQYNSQPLIGTICGMVFFVSIYFNSTKLGPLAENQGTAFFLSLLLIPIFLREIVLGKAQRAIERISTTFFGSFFIPWAIGHLLLLRGIRPSGMMLLYFLFIVIWSIDTGAYAIGFKFGKRKLSQNISPKKTLEGAMGGIAVGIVVSVACRFIFLRNYIGIFESIMLGIFLAFSSQFSDLAESLLKRDVGLKDTSNLLPGHGGMLDRFDSFLFTAPLFYYYLTVIKSF